MIIFNLISKLRNLYNLILYCIYFNPFIINIFIYIIIYFFLRYDNYSHCFTSPFTIDETRVWYKTYSDYLNLDSLNDGTKYKKLDRFTYQGQQFPIGFYFRAPDGTDYLSYIVVDPIIPCLTDLEMEAAYKKIMFDPLFQKECSVFYNAYKWNMGNLLLLKSDNDTCFIFKYMIFKHMVDLYKDLYNLK